MNYFGNNSTLPFFEWLLMTVTFEKKLKLVFFWLVQMMWYKATRRSDDDATRRSDDAGWIIGLTLNFVYFVFSLEPSVWVSIRLDTCLIFGVDN